MCSCPVLESLRISMCQDLVALNISHPPSLKSLKVIDCWSLEWIELSAENLLSFIYTGQEWIDVSFKSTPRLASILFEFENYSDTAYYALCRLPVDLLQIEYLSLHADSEFELVMSPLKDKRKRGAKEREMVGPSKCPHEHLKTVEITGFTGIAILMEIATYLLNNTARLELMTINGREEFYIHGGELKVKEKSCWPEKIREMVHLLQKKTSTARIVNL